VIVPTYFTGSPVTTFDEVPREHCHKQGRPGIYSPGGLVITVFIYGGFLSSIQNSAGISLNAYNKIYRFWRKQDERYVIHPKTAAVIRRLPPSLDGKYDMASILHDQHLF
jgi:hypothetical protein